MHVTGPNSEACKPTGGAHIISSFLRVVVAAGNIITREERAWWWNGMGHYLDRVLWKELSEQPVHPVDFCNAGCCHV